MLFKKKTVAATSAPAVQSGAFSTDFSLLNGINRAAAFARSIQKTGPVVQGVAMDGAVGDTLKSVFTAQQESLPDAQYAWYACQGFIGFQTMAIIAQNWLVDKSCSMPARDAVRSGYDINIDDGSEADPKLLDRIAQGLKKYRINQNLVQAVKFNRVFGIRVLMFLVKSDDPDYYKKPFNPDGVKKGSYIGITQIDPYWMAPILDQNAAANPMDPHFYDPTWWVINGVQVHRTHLVILRGSEVADVLKPSYLYAGISIPQKIAERVYGAERTSNEAPLLAMTKRMIVYKTDMTMAEADPQAFLAKIQQWVAFMNNFGVRIGSTTDEFEQHDTALSDLDDVIMTQYQIVSGASEVPVTKLLGTVPKGFNSTGEYDESSYHEFLESIQEHDLTPILERHLMLWSRSELGRELPITVVWKPLDALTAEEESTINLAKAQADQIWSAAGAIDGQDIRDRLINDPNSGYTGIEAMAPEPEIIEPQDPYGTPEENQDTPADEGQG